VTRKKESSKLNTFCFFDSLPQVFRLVVELYVRLYAKAVNVRLYVFFMIVLVSICVLEPGITFLISIRDSLEEGDFIL
jgi:hypothetical protein